MNLPNPNPMGPTRNNPPPAVVPPPSNPYQGGGTLITNPVVQPTPQPIYNPYLNPYIPYVDPYGGALRGVAAVTTANADYQLIIQNARLVNQQVYSAQIDNRRRLFDEIRYERMNTPTAQEIYEGEQALALRRARYNPPSVEVWSAVSLNNLYQHLAKQQGAGLKGTRIDLENEMLKKINFTTGAGGSIGLLKEGGQLIWPFALREAGDFADAPKKITDLVPEVVKEIKAGKEPSAGSLKDIRLNLTRMHEKLGEKINELPPTDYIESKRYLNMLEEAYRAMGDPNSSALLNQVDIQQSKNVAELIKGMTEKGLKFAPSVPGTEGAYNALHKALVAYDETMTSLNTPRP